MMIKIHILDEEGDSNNCLPFCNTWGHSQFLF